jgi:predicted CXXCH cytochrome family protein
MVDRTIVAPPHIAGATFVGSQECAQCHEETTKDFTHATHARLTVGGSTKDTSCESCHGPGSKHVDSGGAKGTIINAGKAPESCFQCHLDKRGEFSLPHGHPVMSGKMTCTECHDPHKGNAIKGRGAASLASENDSCLECHTAQKGPFVFKHKAMREGCTSCHNPHGSVNDKMLVQRDANLCLKCHLEHPVVPGNGTILIGEDHRSRLQNGTCWVAGCHEAVHGSNASKTLRY